MYIITLKFGVVQQEIDQMRFIYIPTILYGGRAAWVCLRNIATSSIALEVVVIWL